MIPPVAAGPFLILAVDDDPVSLALTALLLESEGHRVWQAESGERAIEMLSEHAAEGRPDIVLADLQMPGIHGPALARWMRAAVPGALFVAMSASPPENVAGYDAVLKKPADAAALRGALLRTHAAASYAETGAVPVVDERVFGALQRAMPPAGLREVCTAFFDDTGSRIAEIRRLAEAGDFSEMRRLAHTLKGSASMVGASRLARVASEIEAGGYQSVF
jgi:CheY-like chemotaxis protein